MGEKHQIQRKLTKKVLSEFIELLSKFGNVTVVCEKLGRTREPFYNRREKDPEFAKAWDEAKEYAIDLLEEEARRRAYDGWDEPIYTRGMKVGSIRKYSDKLLMFLLNGNRPEKYQYRAYVKQETEIKGNITIEVVRFGEITDKPKDQITSQRVETPVLPTPVVDLS